METDSRPSCSEISAPHKTQPSAPSTSEFRDFVPGERPSLLYRLRDENPLAGSRRGDPLLPSFTLANRSKIQQSPNE